MTTFGKMLKSMMGSLPPEVTTLSRGGETKGEQHLSKIFRTVIQSFLTTLEDGRLEKLIPILNATEPEVRGFAYEGAALGLVALDSLLPWKKRFQALVAGPGSPYVYPAYVGAGVALARLGKQPEHYLSGLDPVLSWLVVDGSGFRGALFSRPKYIEARELPEHLSPYARRVFDQGMGRGIWFFTSANRERIVATIASFSSNRQADMWGGVGFACAYAGGMEREDIERLQEEAGPYRLQLARGAAIGAKGRQRGGNMAPHTELACEVLCGLSGNEAASITDLALQNLPTNGDEPAYGVWQQRIEEKLIASAAGGMQSELRLERHKEARS